MRKNEDQNNSEYGHFSGSAKIPNVNRIPLICTTGSYLEKFVSQK